MSLILHAHLFLKTKLEGERVNGRGRRVQWTTNPLCWRRRASAAKADRSNGVQRRDKVARAAAEAAAAAE